MPHFGVSVIYFCKTKFFNMDRIIFFKDRNYLVASIQGYVSPRVIEGMKERGFCYDRDTRVYRAPYSERAESYVKYLDEMCRKKEENKPAIRTYRPKRLPYLELFNDGLSIEEIAAKNDVTESTVYENLLKSINEGKLDYHRLMSDDRLHMIQNYLSQKESPYLRQLKDEAPFELDYWEIKLAQYLMN